jgi:hypothetical protein
LWRFENARMEDGRLRADDWSLSLLEQALLLYENSPGLSPEQAPPAVRDACALLDCELMRLTVERAGLSFEMKGTFLETGTA